MAWGTIAKSAWSDKFRQPSLEELRNAVPKPLQSVLDEARERLGGLDGASETLVWQGVPWRWTLVYTAPGSPDSRALVYLIPDPQRLQLCVPLDQELIEQVGLKRLKKSIREGVVFARNVAGVWWPTWDVQSKTALDEVFDLISRKHALTVGSKAGEPVGA